MLIQPLFEHAEKTPDQIAVRDDQGEYSFRQLASLASAFSIYLLQQTDKPAVGLLLPAGVGFAPVSTERCWLARAWCRSTSCWAIVKSRMSIADSGIDPWSRSRNWPAGW